MRISPNTVAILKNFATINDRILIEPGNELNIVARHAVLGKATVAESFPVKIGIYSLSNFLKVVELFKAADCDFQDTFVLVREADGEGEVRYVYAAESCIPAKTPKNLSTLPPESIDFDLPEEKWIALQKASSVLEKKEMRIRSDGVNVSITTYNHKYPGGNEFSTPLAAVAHGFRCNAIFQMDNVKLLKGSYHGTVTPRYTVFKNVAGHDLTYWIGCDPQSTFD
jgi:hypothetical protein